MTEPLYLDDGTAEQCVALCDRIIDKFESARETATNLDRVSGFGGFDSAQQLQQGFERKLVSGPGSVQTRLTQFIDAMKLMRESFAANGRGFEDTDSELFRALSRISVTGRE